MLVLGISSFVVLFKKSRIGLFAIYVIFMTVLSAWGYRLFFLMDYEFGQNDLMRMAKIAKEGGYNLVLAKGVVLHGGEDITQAVIKALK